MVKLTRPWQRSETRRSFLDILRSIEPSDSPLRFYGKVVVIFPRAPRSFGPKLFTKCSSSLEQTVRFVPQSRPYPDASNLASCSLNTSAGVRKPRHLRGVAFILCARSVTKLHSTNPIERLNKEVKRRADVVGIFPNEASIMRLIGAVLFEQNDEWQTASRYMMVEAFAQIDKEEIDPILSITTKAA